MLRKMTPQWLKQATKTTRLRVARLLSLHDHQTVQLLQAQLKQTMLRFNEKVQEQSNHEKTGTASQGKLADQLNSLLQEKALWQVEKYFFLQEQDLSRKLTEGQQAELQALRARITQLEQELNHAGKVAA